MARAGKIIEARDGLYSLMLRNPDSPQRIKIKSLLSDLADQWLFGEKVLAGDQSCTRYKVQSGDLLSKIGMKYDVPWEFLLKINNILRPEMLRAGQTIKVVNGPFNAVISRSTFTMDVYLNEVYVKSYKVGLGADKHQTPTGLWVVGRDKLVSPRWTDPDSGRTYDATDPDYPLGKRWIGLKGVAGESLGRTGFALHGTNEPESIGQRRSRGCIRLTDKDILEVYDMMAPGKSQVQIVD
jgi:LysM repeat protein